MSSEQLDKKPEEQEIEDIDLLDPNNLLMKKFRELAPGTHKHTQSAEGMGENVCAYIDWKPSKKDMSPDTMKLAFLYHDIGKMWFPSLYSENQKEDNVHDGIDPWVSYQLITRHVSDTVAIMIAYNFPREVIKIASQHHGTCVVKGMIDKLIRTGADADPDDFRYKTERPDCIESLILMMCDQVEASSRSVYLDQKKNVSPDDLVGSVFKKLHADGQFDNVETKLGKLKKIQEALISDVDSWVQKRPKHDDNDELKEVEESE